MARLFPAMDFLYLHDSAIDLYLNRLREAINSIPHEVLQVEISCKPIITDYTDEGEGCGIVLGYGFHTSDFNDASRFPRHPLEGLAFCLNPPFAKEVENIRMYHTKNANGVVPIRSSFTVGQNRFILTNQEFDLDEIVCGRLKTGEIYKKPEPCKPTPTNNIPF